MGDGLGAEGRVVAEGHLESSGSYVVEEEEEEDEEDEGRPAGVYRRLIFLRNEGVVQTEVRDGEAVAINSQPTEVHLNHNLSSLPLSLL